MWNLWDLEAFWYFWVLELIFCGIFIQIMLGGRLLFDYHGYWAWFWRFFYQRDFMKFIYWLWLNRTIWIFQLNVKFLWYIHSWRLWNQNLLWLTLHFLHLQRIFGYILLFLFFLQYIVSTKRILLSIMSISIIRIFASSSFVTFMRITFFSLFLHILLWSDLIHLKMGYEIDHTKNILLGKWIVIEQIQLKMNFFVLTCL